MAVVVMAVPVLYLSATLFSSRLTTGYSFVVLCMDLVALFLHAFFKVLVLTLHKLRNAVYMVIFQSYM